ncbi:PAS domain S-box [Desulfosporosinus orientis DSM 765]|uniref:PAS domain S-box n=1 Tax=Desulfosporosinus orientis (strain ATCC 19365 / DSM 765 / NCIMB 8382 / VKM B-1628 / Singapore I) TaxID=768706 RepID=G7WIA5_DESOD|nr:sigma-54-dependent Fis family transcriptional regulator [Desulfosporosinus orientis]AET68553.1 PAS domain S-box [Desulfosporosinus orientis DSM 765]
MHKGTKNEPTIAVFSYHALTSLINKLQYKASYPVRILVIDCEWNDVLQKAEDMEKTREADVFVSAGGTAKLLSTKLSNPLVEIKVTGFDILNALKEAKHYSDTVGIIAYESKIPNLDNFSELLNISIKQFTYQKLSDIEECLNHLQNEGIKVVIGGSFLQEVISKRGVTGIKGIFIYSSDGVTRALDTAVQVAFSKQVEARKAEELRTILAFSYEGIIAVDRDGLITVINSSAEKIIGASEYKVIGKSITKVFPNAKLTKVIQSCKAELNQIETFGNSQIVINRIPISVNSEVIGAVATFQNIGIFQEVEEKIRKSLFQKGFVAKTSIKDIIGTSDQIQKVKREAFLYAKNASSVLITGESGTGKELFAQGIHNASIRFRHPFVTINCAAIPDNLLESELFGYEEGAFTGAKKGGKPGLFELAHEGTVFLDEIGELSMSLQSRLLRVLEQREVLRIGSDHIRSVNIQVISATNKDLWEMTEKGYFRKDLYYRLNVLELRLPPLRVRKTDIPLLVKSFLTEMCHDLNEQEIERISKLTVFRDYNWPGNIRELRNIVERFAALYKEEDHESLLLSLFERLTFDDLGSGEQAELIRVLNSVKGNKTEAAKKLGISRTTMWRKLKGYKEKT